MRPIEMALDRPSPATVAGEGASGDLPQIKAALAGPA